MDFSRYPEKIQNLVNQVLEARGTNQKLVAKYCNEIIDSGQEMQDACLLGFAYYYLAEGYCVENDYDKFVENLTISVEYQRQSSQWRLLARSYNMLGVNENTQGNVAIALDHYLMALKYCEDYRFDYEKAMVYTNIGHIYLAQKDYHGALEYFFKGRRIFEQESQEPFSRTNIVLIDIAMGRAYLALGDMEKALAQEKEIARNEKEILKDDESALPMLFFRARMSYTRGSYEECEEYIRTVIATLDDCNSILDVQDNVRDFVTFLLETEHFEEFTIVAEKVGAIIDTMGIAKIKKDMRRFWVKYYQKLQDEEKYLRACAKLYELEEIFEEETINTIRNSTQLRFKLEEAKRKEEKLVQEKLALIKKSETDALTGIPNRYRLNDYAEQIFEKAFEKQKNLGIEMIDIDYFKEYNDTYGHPAGDKTIQVLAECLKSIAEQRDFFCARYGGDEFILVYYDKTDEEILEIAREIKDKIRQLQMEHTGSQVSKYVTISQGIRNTVPKNGNKLWDYEFGADTALYKMKKRGRNGIFLVHRMAAESDDSIMIKE